MEYEHPCVPKMENEQSNLEKRPHHPLVTPSGSDWIHVTDDDDRPLLVCPPPTLCVGGSVITFEERE